MLKTSISFFFTILFSCSQAQDYQVFYQKMHIANTVALAGYPDSAIVLFEDVFDEVDYVNTRYLHKVLELAKSINDNSRIDKYKTQIQVQLKGTNPKLRAIIDSLGREDQRVRDGKHTRARNHLQKRLKNDRTKKYNKRYTKAKKRMEDWIDTDSSNIHYLLKLFDQYGFIGEKLVGSEYISVLTILTHFDKDSANSVLNPIFHRARVNGRIRPIHAAQIQDRHQFMFNRMQTYWTWPAAGPEKLNFGELDIPKILNIRESIWIYGSDVSQEYKRGYWVLRNNYAY